MDASTDRPLPVYDIPECDIPEWDSVDDRVTCGKCSHRSGFRCIPLACSTQPLDLKHRCVTFSPRIARLPPKGV